jgi:putative membrane protein
MKNLKFAAVVVSGLLMGACSMNTGMSSGTMGSMNGMSTMSEGDIAAIVTTANQGEIQQGQAASSRATSSDVRAFAQMMVSDHTNALNMAQTTFSRRGITPNMSNAIATQLQSSSQQTVSALNTYTGASFDRTYMQTQVDLHQWLLNSLDTVLIPSARTSDVRQLLQTQRASVATHLERARQILGTL